MTMETALVLVHKKPQLGVGKQRLAARFGTALTLRIAQSLLTCALEDAASWPGPVVLSPASPEDYVWAREQAESLSSRFMIVPQISGNLGQRLNALDAVLRGRELKQLVYIGSDSPELEKKDYEAVREKLDHSNAVLMPAVDGGIVLMANRIGWPDLSALPWSTDRLGTMLIRKCQQEMDEVDIMQESYDVDEPLDFLRLADALENDDRPARRALHALVCDIVLTLNASPDRSHV